ncbi:MAG: hypothetical protein WBA31_05005 [Candidatus Dormiibacterota bacterium]
MKRLIAAIGLSGLLGLGAVVLAAPALAWTDPAVNAVCSCSTTQDSWTVTLADESAYAGGATTQTLDYSFGGVAPDYTSPAGSFTEPTTGGTDLPFTTAAQSAGTVIYVWFVSDITAYGSASAAATDSATIWYDYGVGNCDPTYGGSPCFGPPNTGLAAGDTTVLTLTVYQPGVENPDMTVDLKWNGNMTFVSSGDTSAVCTPVSATEESCFYTDASNSYKSDSYTFTVGSNAPGTVITTDISIATESAPGANDGCSDSGTATITMAQAPVGGQLAASTGTPTTGSGLGTAGLLGGLAILGGLTLLAGARLRRKGSIV